MDGTIDGPTDASQCPDFKADSLISSWDYSYCSSAYRAHALIKRSSRSSAVPGRQTSKRKAVSWCRDTHLLARMPPLLMLLTTSIDSALPKPLHNGCPLASIGRAHLG